jgi:5-methylcytosine-specific restriction endonuclease McrA
MKEKILELRNQGKSYNQIVEILGCSKGTVSYYCGNNQKEKNKERAKNLRIKNPLLKKIDNFKNSSQTIKKFEVKENKEERYIKDSIRKFQIVDYYNGNKSNKLKPRTFNFNDVLNKFGVDTKCYLSGEPINLYKNNYNLDHIIPVSRNGDNSIDNLGITHEIVNRMKNNLTPDELIEWCIKILTYNGYNVSK